MNNQPGGKEGKASKNSLEKAIIRATEKMGQITGLKVLGVVGAVPESEGSYAVKIEFVERQGIPDTMDLIGLYDVNLDSEGNILGYTRVDMRKRGEGY